MFRAGEYARLWIGIGEIKVIGAVLGVAEGVARWKGGRFHVPIGQLFKCFFVVVEHREAASIDFQGRFDFDVGTIKSFAPFASVNGTDRRQPGQPLARPPHCLFGEAVGPGEVGQINADFRIETPMRGQLGNDLNLKIAERIARAIGVAPKPENFVPMVRVENGVGAEDHAVENSLFQRGFDANQNAVGVDAAAGQSIEALGDVDAMNLQRGGTAGCDVERRARMPKPSAGYS